MRCYIASPLGTRPTVRLFGCSVRTKVGSVNISESAAGRHSERVVVSDQNIENTRGQQLTMFDVKCQWTLTAALCVRRGGGRIVKTVMPERARPHLHTTTNKRMRAPREREQCVRNL